MDCLVAERLRMSKGTEEGEARDQSDELSKVWIPQRCTCTQVPGDREEMLCRHTSGFR